MTQVPLAPPPPGNNPGTDKWLWLLWRRLTQAGQFLWSSLDFSGSNLTDLETRNHSDLQNINTSTYYHLTQTNHDDLTDGGATSLHKHDHSAQDNLNSANYYHLTQANHTDLTDGNDSTLHYHASDRARANHTGTQVSDTVLVPYILSPDNTDVTDWFNTGSAGSISGGVISATGTQIEVTAGQGVIKSGSTNDYPSYFFEWAALPLTTITDNKVTWVCADYNSGTPQISLHETTTSDEPPELNYNSCFPLGTCIREGSTIHVTNNPRKIQDATGGLIRRFHQTLPWARDELVGGILLGETGTRNITLTAGYLFDRQNRFEISAIDTSVSDVFDIYYRDGASGFTKVASATQWPNTQYDDGTGTLATMLNNRYANLFWYIEGDGDLVMLYGRNEYVTAASASEESQPDTLPLRLQTHGRLIARTTFQKSASTLTAVDSAFSQTFTTSAISNHNNLSGLQGGTTSEYYHLTSSQHTDLTDGGDSTLHAHFGNLSNIQAFAAAQG